MDIENRIIDLIQFHRTFKRISGSERLVAELNAAHLMAEWSEVTIDDCQTVLQNLATADLSQGNEYYMIAIALMSMAVYQNAPIKDKRKYVNYILQSDIIPLSIRNKMDKGWTVGEVLMDKDVRLTKSKGGDNKFKWQGFKSVSLDEVRNSGFEENTAVCLIEPDDGIYAYRETDGTLVLSVKVKQTEDILAGEEMLNGEIPYYYTPSSHFTSPVWKLRAMRKALLETFSFLEFPVVPIRYQVILPSKDQKILDEDKLWKKDWKNLPLKIIYGKDECSKMAGCPEWPMKEAWGHVLSAAAAHYSKFKQKPSKAY